MIKFSVQNLQANEHKHLLIFIALFLVIFMCIENFNVLLGEAYIWGYRRFATWYLEDSEAIKWEIVQFATMKLLNADYITETLSNNQALACLFQWLPFEFNSMNYLLQEKKRE